MFLYFAVVAFVLGTFFGVASLFVTMKNSSWNAGSGALSKANSIATSLLKVNDPPDPKSNDLTHRTRLLKPY